MAKNEKDKAVKKKNTQKKSKAGAPKGKAKGGQPSRDTQKNIEMAHQKLESKARIKDEIIGVILVAIGVFFIIALQTHAAGVVGEWFSTLFKGCFGLAAFIIPYYFIIYGVLLFLGKTIHTSGKSVFYLVVIYLMLVLINAGRFMEPYTKNNPIDVFGNVFERFDDGVALQGGGVFGSFVGGFLTSWIGIPGLYMLSFVVLFIFLLLIINTPVSRFVEGFKKRRQRREIERAEKAKEAARQAAEERERQRREQEAVGVTQQPRINPEGMYEGMRPGTANSRSLYENDTKSAHDKKRLIAVMNENPDGNLSVRTADKTEAPQQIADIPASAKRGLTIGGMVSGDKPADKPAEEPAKAPEKITNSEARSSRLSGEDFNESEVNENYEFPPIEVLKRGRFNSSMESEAVLRDKAIKLEDTLRSFNIDATVTNVTQGPAVTRYEVHPNSGVKVKGIKALADDIALNMEAKSIRIEAPIPGKPAVGIEIENDKINMVTVREIVESPAFMNAESKLTFAVGKDIAGKAIVADLKSMPHLLIAGSTGSGKSVCVNSIITSILFKARPDEVKMVLIDPKVVELSNYNGIPHLLIPVVTDPAKAAAALNWAVAEMDDRYRKFADVGARELASYNEIIEKNNAKALKEAGRNTKTGEGEGEPVVLEPKMPQVVIIIDELADLMMAAPSQVEESICRLAQKARAAGMHLIVATQRPSVDVITGVIKANIPSRIAFAVSSQVDSRTILDMAGAEKLVGKGDMLFNPLGNGKPTRVQGTFISDEEVHDVIEFVKSQGTADEAKANDVMDSIKKANMADADKTDKEYEDELLPTAIDLVVHAGQASVSMLQRRFRIGYNRAARIIDMMEARQIVGPQDGSRPRQVLLSEEDLAIMNESVEDIER